MTLHSPTENSLAVLNHKILEANSQVQNVKLGGHQTCLSINRLWHELSNESQYSRDNGPGERREANEKVTGLEEDQGERHTSVAIRSSPSAWTEPNRRTKKCRKETLGYKRSFNSGFGGPERKYRKAPVHQGDKRKLIASSNTLTHFRKRVKREETAVPGTSRYNLRPRRGERVQSRPSSEKKTSPIQRKKRATIQPLRRGTRNAMRSEYQKQKSRTATAPGE
ncbi:uncharacterized protein TNCV_1179201 [Trichonephila clavipes]|nr:uncharacterized protein TNCV_1179201 [Trichonephila clavipes]